MVESSRSRVDALFAEALDQPVAERTASLASFNMRLAHVVECRFFAGMTEDETAAALDSSTRTVQRDWKRARAWLRKELE